AVQTRGPPSRSPAPALAPALARWGQGRARGQGPGERNRRSRGIVERQRTPRTTRQIRRPTMHALLPSARLSIGIIFAAAAAAPAAAQQTERYALAGANVAVYNLAGEVRVEAGSGSEVVVELARGGAD